MSKIGVFPAAGGLGSSITNHLLQLVPASRLILIARNPSPLSTHSQAGATVRRADYDDPASLGGAFDGVDVLMLISYASIEIEHREQAHRNAIDVARRSGVKHIFYSSLAFGGNMQMESVAHVMRAHLTTEKYLAQLAANNPDFSFTAVREGLYSESFPIYTSWFDLSHPVEEIAIPHPGTGPGVAWAKRDELGEATAKLIVSYADSASPASFAYLNRGVLLTGPREVTLAEMAGVLGRVAGGRPGRVREISVDEYAGLPHGGRHTYHGVDLARSWTTAFEAIRRGEAAVVSPSLGEILGREPEAFEVTVRGMV